MEIETNRREPLIDDLDELQFLSNPAFATYESTDETGIEVFTNQGLANDHLKSLVETKRR